MPKSARTQDSAQALFGDPQSVRPHRRQKTAVYLVSRDDALWPQIGPHVGAEFNPKQVDSIDEFLSLAPAGQAGIVLWDARDEPNHAAALSRIQLHSAQFAVVALDDARTHAAWAVPVEQRQVVALLRLPLETAKLLAALASAQEEVAVRTSLLGTTPAVPARAAKATAARPPWFTAAIAGAVLGVAGIAFMLLRPSASSQNPGAASSSATSTPPTTPGSPSTAEPTAAKPAAATDEQVDLLIEKAQQAMLSRHYLDPADGSALSLYREALTLDPSSGEARQGLQRLAEVLISRVQAALDERKFDLALQALETARSINPADSRLAAFDERIASLRAEIGPAQIEAALNAQNFDRAAQLIDESARAKLIAGPKLAQLREDLRRRRGDADVTRDLALVDARTQQDRLIDPHNDSAVYYLALARDAGASSAALQAHEPELYKRLTQAATSAVEQRRFSDADRLLGELRSAGAPAASLTSLQQSLSTARASQQQAKAEQASALELAQTRLAQGSLIEPEEDSALFYVKKLRAADPNSSALAPLTAAIQGQILQSASVALDAAQTAKAETLLHSASELGASPEFDALNQRLLQAKLAATSAASAIPEVLEGTLTRTRPLDPDYPQHALLENIEGWVEVAYTVTPTGTTSDIRVLRANPPGLFDGAATKAIARLRYTPPQRGGKAAAVTTRMRVSFRVAKP